MIDPHVVHGGASSWFRIAAPENDGLSGAPEGAPLRASSSGAAASTFGAATGAGASALASDGSFMFTPALNCASGLRNFVAIQRKM